jgi:hypothetical protein
MSIEEWRKIEGWPYEVSSIGRVRNLKGHIMATHISKYDGRYFITLRNKGKQAYHRVHRLMLTAFVGECPEGMECAHLNGIQTDNRIENLKWVTRKENMAHQYLHGTRIMGERSAQAKLTIEQAIEIKNTYKKRSNFRSNIREICKKFNISESVVRNISKGLRWNLAIQKYEALTK